jgi:hypothetical protein
VQYFHPDAQLIYGFTLWSAGFFVVRGQGATGAKVTKTQHLDGCVEHYVLAPQEALDGRRSDPDLFGHITHAIWFSSH